MDMDVVRDIGRDMDVVRDIGRDINMDVGRT